MKRKQPFDRVTIRILGHLLLTAIAVFALSINARAEPLPQPESPVFLTVSGEVGRTNRDGRAMLDRNMFEAIGLESVTTTTPWYDQAVTFEGVRAARLMTYLDINSRKVTASALNQYQAALPVSDFLEHDVLLAIRADGKYLSVRDKGPIFIIYPFDDNEDLRNETYFARSVWQLTELRFSGGPLPESPAAQADYDSATYAVIAVAVIALLAGLVLANRKRHS